jgi:hypothetical protein
MSRLGDLISIPKTLLHYRLSPGSITGTRRIEAKDMTTKLLTDIGINQSNILGLVENFESVQQLYKQHNFASERELLILRDLYFLAKNAHIGAKARKSIKQILIRFLPKHTFNISSFRAIKVLHHEQSMRNSVRNNG